MQNYHRHTSYSNIFTADSAAVNEDYAKRAVELGHKSISSVEHGYQGYYYEVFELAKKYGLKFIFGAEAYWVKEKESKDRTNCHIIMLAKNENGRRAINRILSDANEIGYYYKPRVDIPLLLSLPANDVIVTTACIAFWHYGDIEDVLMQLHEHFGANLFLEIQNHNTEKQRLLNQRILKLSKQHDIQMIVGLDSHYINEEQAKERDYVLEAKGIRYEDEDGWYMDYPSDDVVIDRFLAQGIFTESQIKQAMDNTDIVLEFEDIVLNDDIKLPPADTSKTLDERKKMFSQLITKKYKEYIKTIPQEEHERYFEGIKREVEVYKNTNMVDYPLIDFRIVERAKEKGGIITDSGRGSGVGYFTNTLCGFSKVDRFTSPIKLYPERFISESRILETRSLPDLDLNCGNPEIFAEAQDEVLTEIFGESGHSYPMIAFGTFKRAAAFKLFARAKKLNFDIANKISQQLKQYDDAVKYAEDDERDEIDVYDYVDEQYHSYIKNSEAYMGIISDKKKAPCAYLIYGGNIREEIGLIKCKSETTKKEYITTVIDGAIAEKYKFLKNDLLKVDVVLLIDLIFKRANEKHLSVNELMAKIKGNKKVWDIYSNGYTIGVNQCEKRSTTNKLMNYKPQNISELTAFIAAIRPAFKTMYKRFETRESFSYGIKAFDKILQTPEFPQSYILYQEQTMNTLNYAGFPLDECYGIIKAIAKKHPEKVRPLKSRFIDGFKKRIIEEDGVSESEAIDMSEKVWQIIDDSCGYGFNSAHAYCMALDSLYNAYQKANYTYEFYEVMMQVYSDKGKKDKVSALKQEMKRAFGISEGDYKFGLDNRAFKADKENAVIYPSLLSLKGLSQKSADDLYKLSQKKQFNHFYDLYKELVKLKSTNAGKRKVLIKIGYFNDFGTIGKIEAFVKCIEDLFERSEFNKSTVSPQYLKYIIPNSAETEKQYNKFDYDKALYQIWDDLEETDITLNDRLKNELEYLGYVKSTVNNISPQYAFVQEYECKFKNPKITLYRLCNSDIDIVKVKRKQYDEAPIQVGDIIKTIELSNEGRWFNEGKDEEGKDIWRQDKDDKEQILKKWSFVR